MVVLRILALGAALTIPLGIAAANNKDADADGFIWIDANTRIKVKTVSTINPAGAAGSGASAPEKAPKKEEKKEKPAK